MLWKFWYQPHSKLAQRYFSWLILSRYATESITMPLGEAIRLPKFFPTLKKIYICFVFFLSIFLENRNLKNLKIQIWDLKIPGIFSIQKNFRTFFVDRKKINFWSWKKNRVRSFDVKNRDLSIYDVSRVFLALLRGFWGRFLFSTCTGSDMSAAGTLWHVGVGPGLLIIRPLKLA